jgi:hypothetical protein
MIRQRNLTGLKLKPHLPPFRALSAAEVKVIADAGKIEFNGCRESVRQFELALDRCRDFYKSCCEAREYCLTDKQITDRLEEAKDLAARLLTLLDGPLLSKTVLIEYEAWMNVHHFLTGIHEPLRTIVRWAECGIEEVNERKARNPNSFYVKSAVRAGLKELLIELTQAWRVATGISETGVGMKSPLIDFLQQAVRTIAQLPVGPDTARKWARENMRIVASRPIHRGYYESHHPAWRP